MEFHTNLSDMKKKNPLVLLVDGVDLVQDGGGQLSSDWIPQQLPQVSYMDRKLSEKTFKKHLKKENEMSTFS